MKQLLQNKSLWRVLCVLAIVLFLAIALPKAWQLGQAISAWTNGTTLEEMTEERLRNTPASVDAMETLIRSGEYPVLKVNVNNADTEAHTFTISYGIVQLVNAGGGPDSYDSIECPQPPSVEVEANSTETVKIECEEARDEDGSGSSFTNVDIVKFPEIIRVD